MKLAAAYVLTVVLGLPPVIGVAAPVCVDGDIDGICDQDDACLYSEAGSFVDARGCALDGDQDADGIADQADRCPYSPAGATIDADGCALDGDGDGVADGIDRCPSSASGGVVDLHGCGAVAGNSVAPPETGGAPDLPHLPWTVEGYVRNSSNIPPPVLSRLRALAPGLRARLDADPALRLEITGFADAELERALADELAENRSALLRAALGAAGVPMPRISARAGGADGNGARAVIAWRAAAPPGEEGSVGE